MIVLRHEPQEYDEQERFRGTQLHPACAVLQQSHQRQNARREGRDPHQRPARPQRRARTSCEKFASEVGPGDAGIPFVQVKAAIAERWAEEAGRNLDEIQAGIDKDLHPRSFDLPAIP